MRAELAAKHPEITAAAVERLHIMATLPRNSPTVQAFYLPRNEMRYLAEETREELEAEEPQPRYSAQGAMVLPEPGTACGIQGLHTLLLQGKVAGIDALQARVRALDERLSTYVAAVVSIRRRGLVAGVSQTSPRGYPRGYPVDRSSTEEVEIIQWLQSRRRHN